MRSKYSLPCLIVLTVLLSFFIVPFSLVHAQSTVGTSTNSEAVAFMEQRKSFYANGRFWVWYGDGSNLVYSSSIDGVNWETSVSVGICVYGCEGSVFFDGTYVHYSRVNVNTMTLFYRRGIPNSNGSITWSANEQTVFTMDDGIGLDDPVVCVDSDGRVWIGTADMYGDGYPYVIKNENTNGTWSTADGFPYQLSVNNRTWLPSMPIPLTAGRVYVIYADSLNYLYGKLYDGDSWGEEESVSTKACSSSNDDISATSHNAEIYLAYFTDDDWSLRYRKRTNGVGWGDEAVLYSVEYERAKPAISINPTNDDIFIFWLNVTNDHVYYKKCVNGVWDSSPTDWINESIEHFPYMVDVITCFYQAYSGYIGVAYMTKTSSPYNVKFGYLTVATSKMTLLESLNQIFLTENIFSYLLLMIFALLIFMIGVKVKYGALVAVPIGLLTGVYWLTNGLGWHFIILLFSSIGVMFLVATGKAK